MVIFGDKFLMWKIGKIFIVKMFVNVIEKLGIFVV